QRSREHLSDLVFRKDVRVEWTKRDHWGRILGKVLVADPACEREPCELVDANLAQVRAGMAWWYRQYAKEQPAADRRAYADAEGESRAARRGLWADPSPTPPWQWRRVAKKGRAAEGKAETAPHRAAAAP
ncbi:MAG TPA: thermonuclease family protein, partial [Vulgatibacter sp.]|nr:thermonuclease family protein [Vulgatibacter sp.]